MKTVTICHKNNLLLATDVSEKKKSETLKPTL